MARASHFLPALNGGELSPLLMARIDLARHGTACARLENLLPLPEGPVTRRPGSEMLGWTARGDGSSWLRRFVFGPKDAAILELAHQTLRFWAKGGLILDPDAEPPVPLQMLTPWSAADLGGGDGILRLTTAQARDRLWLAGAGKPPMLLERRGAADWQLLAFDPEDGPFAPENKNDAIRLKASAVSGDAVTIDALGGAEVFTAAHQGRLIRLFARDLSAIRAWEAQMENVAVGELRRVERRVYEAVETPKGISGTVIPTHTRGEEWDSGGTFRSPSTGDKISGAGIKWRFLHPGYGLGRITAVAGPSQATIEVIDRLPESIVDDEGATERWQLSAWDDAAGWPEAVGFAFDRLVMARGNRVWFSRTDDFFSFADRSFGEVLADDALSITLTGPEITNVRWLQETSSGLVVGTDGGEVLVTKPNTSEVFGAATDATRNVQARQHTSYGASRVRPVLAHGRTLMVQASGSKVRELEERIETGRLSGFDMGVFAGHMLRPGVVWTAWQGEPDGILWHGLADGSMVSLTYLPEQEIIAWARHRIGGPGAVVEWGETMPTDDGNAAELWLVVRRSIDNVVERTIERLAPRWRDGAGLGPAASRHLDGMLVYQGQPVSSVSGADHLAGQTVSALLDGFVAERLAVAPDGSAALPFAASTVVLGHPYESGVVLLVPNAGGMDGPGIGKKRRARKLVLTLVESADRFKAGVHGRLRRVDTRAGALPADQPAPLVSDDVELMLDLGWKERPKIEIAVDGPLPFTLAAVMQKLDLNE